MHALLVVDEADQRGRLVECALHERLDVGRRLLGLDRELAGSVLDADAQFHGASFVDGCGRVQGTGARGPSRRERHAVGERRAIGPRRGPGARMSEVVDTVTAMSENQPASALPEASNPRRVRLDPSQAAVLDAPADESLAVVGAPGSGKTTTLVELLAHRAAADGLGPDGVLALAPGRTQATALRDRLAARIGGTVSGVRARTPQSLAFQIVREHRAATGAHAPSLRTGADDDALIGQLIEGRDDAAAGGAGVAAWFGFEPPITDEVMRLGGFRDEVRALIAAMNEYDVTPDELASLASHRPAWRGAAALAAEFAEVADLDRPGSIDVPGLLLEAASLLHAEAARDRYAIDAVRLVAVDDAHELTESARRLLVALEARGVTVVTFGDPDVATGVFRGGGAERATGWRPDDEPAPRRLLLSTVHRHGEGMRSLVSSAVARIGVRGEGRHRAALPSDSAPAGTVQTVVASSPVDEARAIASWLRRRHLEDGTEWRDMAVLVRSSGAIGPLSRLLARGEVPTTAVRAADPADDPAVAAIVRLALAAADPDAITGDTVTAVLESPLFGVDALRLRQLRRALRLRDHEAGGRRRADDLLVEAVMAPRDDSGLGVESGESTDRLGVRLPANHPALVAIRRLAGVIRTAREVAANGAVDEVLWSVWEGAGVADAWRRLALRGGAEGEVVDARLDAVVSLFDTAKRVVERAPSTTIAGFADAWTSRRVTADSLGGRADRDAVTLATPASVVGREFRVVAIAGVNDGAWPNLRIRDSLLGAQHLTEVVTGRGEGVSIVDRRREVLDDESRMFAQALSRAREHLLVTAIEGDDAQPSVLFRRLDAERLDLERLRLPSTLRELTGWLRSRARRLAADGSSARAEATALAALARAGVAGAHPDDWQGLRGWTTTRPLVEMPVGGADARGGARHSDGAERDPVVFAVRPSQIETFEACGIDWFVGAHSGGSTSSEMRLGTIVHASAEFAFATSGARLDYVGERLGELEPQSSWEVVKLERKMTDMLGGLESYLDSRQMAGVRVLGAERSFVIELPIAELDAVVRVTGTIDRIESDASGEVVVVDLKTGSKKPTKAEAATHAQMLAYQLAVRVGTIGVPTRRDRDELPAPPVDDGSPLDLAGATGGARLVFVGTGTAQQSEQSPMTDEVAHDFGQRLLRSAFGMAGLEMPPPGEPIGTEPTEAPAAFLAMPEAHCENEHRGAKNCRIHTVPEVTE